MNDDPLPLRIFTLRAQIATPPLVRKRAELEDLTRRFNQRSQKEPDTLADGPLKWYDDEPHHPPWIAALADVRRQATLEGYCYQHVQAIVVAIDQYAEAALGKRAYFLNRPHRIG